MNAEERAYKIWLNHPCDTSEPDEQIEFTAAQIREAEKEAFKSGCNTHLATCVERFNEGRASMREEAAKVAEGDWQCGNKKCSHYFESECISNAIRALKSPGAGE